MALTRIKTFFGIQRCTSIFNCKLFASSSARFSGTTSSGVLYLISNSGNCCQPAFSGYKLNSKLYDDWANSEMFNCEMNSKNYYVSVRRN